MTDDVSKMPDDTPAESEGAPEPSDPGAALGNFPEDRQREFLQMFTATASATMRAGNPLLDLFTGQHITDILAMQNARLGLEYQDLKHSRWLLLGFVVFVIPVGAGFATFLALRSLDGLLADLITKVSIGLGGFGAGWGASAYWNRRR